MSIWTSIDIPTPDVHASDLRDPTTNHITAAGRDDLEIDVATATTWNNRIRLAVFPADGSRHGLDVALTLDADAALVLAERLQIAAGRARCHCEPTA